MGWQYPVADSGRGLLRWEARAREEQQFLKGKGAGSIVKAAEGKEMGRPGSSEQQTHSPREERGSEGSSECVCVCLCVAEESAKF